MRWLLRLLCVCGLGVMPLIGCGETEERAPPCWGGGAVWCDDGTKDPTEVGALVPPRSAAETTPTSSSRNRTKLRSSTSRARMVRS